MPLTCHRTCCATSAGGRAHSGTGTAQYIAGKAEDGGRESDYFLYVKANTPYLQRACFDAIQASGEGRAPGHTELDRSHGRTVRRSIWVTDAGDIDFPQVTRIARIRRDHYDTDGHLVGKEIIHAVTSLDAKKADAEALARIARGQRGIESVHWVRGTARDEDANTGYAGNGPRAMATLRNLAVGPALPQRGKRSHPHSPGHRAQPKPPTRLPSAMRSKSQTTLAIP
jgi:hypothetical protein